MRSRILKHINERNAELTTGCSDIIENGVGADARQIYRGARNTLYDTTANGHRVCVKLFRKAKFPNSYIYTTLRRSKARRSYEHAERLLSLGFLTPEPIAWSERRTGLKLNESYYICEYLDLPNIRGWGEMPDAEPLIAALGRYMVELHRAGVYHRDFSPGNILVERMADGGYRFYLVDINRMEFVVSNRKKQMSMFRSISLDETETRRLAGAYAKAAGLCQAEVETAALKSLHAYLATKRRHRILKRLLGKGKKK